MDTTNTTDTTNTDDNIMLKTMNASKAAIEHISVYQINSIIRFLLYRKIMQCNTYKKRAFLLKELFESLPPTELGSNMVEHGGHKYYATIKPCDKDHDLTKQYSLLSKDLIERFNVVLSQVLYLMGRNYATFMDDYEYIRTMLTEDLPRGKKDITLKIDPSNTTVYIDEDDDIRMGIFIERDDTLSPLQDSNTIMEFEDIMNTQNNDLQFLVLSFLTMRSMIWQYYMTEYSTLFINK